MDPDQVNEELNDMMKDVPSSFVDIKPPPEEEPPEPPDVNQVNISEWSKRTDSAVDGYKFGTGCAAFGNNEMTTENFFKRLSEAITDIVANEYQKTGIGAESLKPHFDILKSTMKLIAKEIETKGLPDYRISTIIAAMQGFMTNYNKKDTK